jgi:hypothetical protein
MINLNNIKNKIFVCSTLLLSAISFSSSASNNNCLIDKYEKYSIEQTHFQNTMAKSILKEKPEFKEITELLLDDQLTAINKNKLALKISLENFPNKVFSDNEMHTWMKLDTQFENKLAELDNNYKNLLDKSRLLKDRPSHKDSYSLQKEMRKLLKESEEFKNILIDFAAKVKVINNLTCTIEK